MLKLSPIFIFFLLIECLSVNQKLFSQSQIAIDISYIKEVDKLIDTIGSENAKSTISKFNQVISEDVKNLTYVLKIRGEYSVFQEMKALKMGVGSNVMQKFASNYGGTRGSFYVHPKDSLYLNVREFSGAYFKVKTEAKKWKIHMEDFKYINNYKCIKASSVDTIINPKGIFTSEVVAWFTSELPGFYGPAGYFGLPGVILELQNGKISLVAKEIDLDTNGESTFDIDKAKGKLVTEQQFDSIVGQSVKKFFGISEF